MATSKRTNADKKLRDLVNSGQGPYEAIVLSHLDPKYMGTLKVDILRYTKANSPPERIGTTIEVKYLSPFYGVTSYKDTSANEGYEFTQKSYGFWAVPPDPGTKVLVIFAENDISRGYWIGCIQDDYMNFMVPDGRASTEFTTEGTPSQLTNLKLPVGEYNKKIERGEGADPTRYRKPYNKDFSQVLEIQGLIGDEFRGTTSTSARREVPSQVFGWSTPGPLDKRPGSPRGNYGGVDDATDNYPINRLGGSSIVMDDGDDKKRRKGPPSETPPRYDDVENNDSTGDPTIPHNELMRFRTRTGHQIVMHNSEDFIYIGNARGTAWIELTSDGKIDVYARDSVSIHSDNDINLTATRDIIMEAGRNILAKATGDYTNTGAASGTTTGNIQIEAFNDYGLRVGRNRGTEIRGLETRRIGKSYTLSTADNISIAAGGYLMESAVGPASMKGQTLALEGTSAVSIRGAATAINEQGNPVYLAAGGTVSAPVAPEAPEIPRLNTHSLPQVEPGNLSPGNLESISKRVPQHEPWPHHEHLNPANFKRDQTDVMNVITLPPAAMPITSDTFAKGGAIRAGDVAGATTVQRGATVDVGSGVTNRIDGPPPVLNTDKQTVARAFAAALAEDGFTEEEQLAAIACANTESALSLIEEASYANTSNERIRSIFSSTRRLSDAELNGIKADKWRFFEYVYGVEFGVGRGLGNSQPGDGGNFIGRGLIQITGRANYTKYGGLAGHPEIVDNPRLLITDLDVSVAVCAAYLKDRYQDFGRGVVGNMRKAIAGTETGYNLGIEKDRRFYNAIVADASNWLSGGGTAVA